MGKWSIDKLKNHKGMLGKEGFWKGKKRSYLNSEERNKKISDGLKQSYNNGTRENIFSGERSGFKKGNIPWNKGLKGFNSGEKSPSWKGGVTSERDKLRHTQEMRYWRKECIERDNFTCQISGQSGGKLIVHHINNFADFPELRTLIENGITMSEKLHKEFHKKYGVKNNTIGQLEEFIQTIQ